MKQIIPSAARMTTISAIALFVLAWLCSISAIGQRADSYLHHVFLLSADSPDAVLAMLRFLTALGGVVFLSALGLLSVALFVVLGKADAAKLLLTTLLGGRLLAIVIKTIVARARPELGDHLVAVHSLSFPSEHAFNTTVTYGLLALLSGNRLAYAAAFGLAASIGASRILLGVHWPTDVIAGWALGAAWLSLCWGLRSDSLRHRLSP